MKSPLGITAAHATRVLRLTELSFDLSLHESLWPLRVDGVFCVQHYYYELTECEIQSAVLATRW